jgi:hypothetical protein
VDPISECTVLPNQTSGISTLLSRSDSGQANAPAESSILDMGIGSFWPSQKAGVDLLKIPKKKHRFSKKLGTRKIGIFQAKMVSRIGSLSLTLPKA